MLGAIVDIIGGKKQFLGVALALGALGSLSLAFLGKDTFLLGALVFAIANLGFAGRFLFEIRCLESLITNAVGNHKQSRIGRP
mgnify:CR=1 FL=1